MFHHHGLKWFVLGVNMINMWTWFMYEVFVKLQASILYFFCLFCSFHGVVWIWKKKERELKGHPFETFCVLINESEGPLHTEQLQQHEEKNMSEEEWI